MLQSSVALSQASDPAIERTATFLDLVFPEPRAFAIRLWDDTVLPGSGSAPFTLTLSSPGSLRRMFRPPLEMAMGEAFLRGDYDFEGDICSAFGVMQSARSLAHSPRNVLELARLWMGLPADSAPVENELGGARLAGSVHSKDRDRAAIQYHYDVGNDFYHLFLDRRMVYSCAYFPSGHEDLDAAQEAKLELICRKLRLQPGERFLDIGCGWGALLIHAAQRFGVQATGVTLSEEQCRLARERVREAGLEGRVTVELRDYRDLRGQFDKVSSVGMFEHVGRSHLPEYFGQVFQLLRPGGLFLNHGISNRPLTPKPPLKRLLDQVVVGNFTFRKRYIFPDGELVPVSEVNAEAERAGFEVRDVENLREHYARTLRHWVQRLEAQRGEAIRIGGERIFRLWRLYMAACAYHFERGMISVNQTLLARQEHDGRVPLPSSRADLYAAGTSAV